MRIGIVGGGVVGSATARALIEHVEEVRVFDAMPERRTHGFVPTLECDLIFICVPEGCIDEVVSERGSLSLFQKAHVVIKSTVPIGTTKRLREQYGMANLIHSPEFLTARVAVTDAHLPARNVIGGEPCDCRHMLENLYRMRFPGVPVYVMTSDESEAVKLVQNSLFAAKVGLMNEMQMLCYSLGLNWHNIMAAVLADGRIAHAHTKVPGPDGKFGFGGTCLPKDLRQLLYAGDMARIEMPICRAVSTRNDLIDRPRKW